MKAKFTRYLISLGVLMTVTSVHAAISESFFDQVYREVAEMETDSGKAKIQPFSTSQLAQAESDETGKKSVKGASKTPSKGSGFTQAQINEMINNPIGELWLLYGQNDTTWYDGDALDFLVRIKRFLIPPRSSQSWLFS